MSNQYHKQIPTSFFRRPAELVAPDLIGCIFVKQLPNKEMVWGIIVETEAYSEEEEACHGYRRRSPSNETLFGEPGHLYVYLSYGIHHCVNIVTDRIDWANGVLLRAIALPGEPERIASGPALLARRFALNRSHDNLRLTGENGYWIAQKPSAINELEIVNTTRIGISQAKELSWRWYLKKSRSVSRRVKGDSLPTINEAWMPQIGTQ